MIELNLEKVSKTILTQKLVHIKKIGSLAQVKKKVMKKSLGGGVNLPHPIWNRVNKNYFLK